MAKDVREAVEHALMDAWDIGYGGGSWNGGCATALGIRGDSATGYHEADVFIVEGGKKRAPRSVELPFSYGLDRVFEPYEGAGYEIGRVCRAGRS